MPLPTPLSLDASIDPHTRWGCWSEMVAGQPSLPGFLLSHVTASDEGEKVFLAAAVQRWMKNSGLWPEDRDHDWNAALGGAMGLKTGDLLRAVEDAEHVEQWYRRLLGAEKTWFEQAPEAPVAVVLFQPQAESGRELLVDTECLLPQTWDGTRAFLDMAVEARDDACRYDTYESDELRSAEGAPREAADWEGPFAVAVAFHPPSAALRAQRTAALLEAETPGAKDTALRRRM